MESEKIIYGTCPFCQNSTSFREFTFAEDIENIGDFIGNFFKSSLSTNTKTANNFYNDINSTRSFPNYKCTNCNQKVMQCSECKEIIQYSHTTESHICGKKSTEFKSNETDDIISKLERLAALKEKGLLTQNEFDTQKAKILQS